jgi:CzcA family heavy metal efflux pump
MIRSIIGSSLQLRFLIIVLAAVLMVVGVGQVAKMPVDVLPEFSQPYVEIRTEALGLSAQEVEQLITLGMEQDLLNGVPWLESIRSESVPGLSSIVLTFDPGTDLNRARQMVTERLAQAFALPHVSKPPTMLQPLSSTSRFMIVGLSSKKLSLIQMSVLARWTIGPRLMGVPGVANVAIWGNRDRQLQVQVDPKQLQAQGVSLDQVLETTGNALWVSSLSFLEASTPGTGGFIDTAQQRLGIWHLSPIVSAADLAQVPVEGAASLRLGDVAKVVEDHQPLIGDAVINDGSNLLLVVEKLPGANTLEVTRGIEETLAALKPGLSGLEMDSSIFRPANFIERSIIDLRTALLFGFVLLILVFSVFLLQWRSALISVLAILLSLLAAVLVLYLRGATMNAIVLAGLLMALSILVDDAIIDVENIMRRLRQNRQEGGLRSPISIIFEASSEVRSPIIYATLIIILAVSPVFFIGGTAGTFFQPLAVSYVLAVFASMLVALTVTPSLCLLLLGRKSIEHRASPLVERFQSAYGRMLARIVERPRPLFLAIAVIMLLGLALLPFLNQSLLPSFKDQDILIHMNAAAGTSQPEMSRIVSRVSAELRAIPGVDNVGANVGRAVFGDQVVNVNSSELWASIDPSADYDATVASIRKVVNGYPGFKSEVETYLQDRTSGLMAKSDNSIVVRLYGDAQGVLGSNVEDVKKALTGIKGVVDLHAALPKEEPTLEIAVDIAKAQKYGIKPGDVRRAAATIMSGIQVGNLFEEAKVFDVVVWGTPAARNSLTSIRELLINTPGGEQVRLGDVADVRVVPVPSVIQHEAVKRYIDITATVQGRSLDAVAADIKSRLLKVQFPLEYHAEVLGGYAERQAARTRIFTVVIAALLGIFLLLQAVYRSWRLAFLSLLILPSALVGGVLAVSATGNVISLGSLIGFLALFGIAARNSVMLINHYQHLERSEGESFGLGLVLRGALDRPAAVLMTALATGLILAPSLILGDIPGLEIIRPMTIVVLGGLVTSTLFSLFVVPTLYLRYGASREEEVELLPGNIADLPAVAADD